LLDRRAALIEGHPADPRRALWLADQATDYLFALLPIEGSGARALFGLPSTAEDLRAREAAAAINDLASEAEIAISEAILDLEASPGFASDVGMQLKRRRLARDERDRRVPFMRGAGAFLHGVINVADGPDRARLLALASEILHPLAAELEGDVRRQALLYAGLAAAFNGEMETAQPILSPIANDRDAAPLESFSARMGLIEARARAEGAPAGLEALRAVTDEYRGRDDLFFRLVIADREFLLRRAMAEGTSGEERSRAFAAAFEAYTGLLDVDLGMPRDALRAIVFARLSIAADRDVPLDAMPAIVGIARAANMAAGAETRSAAIELLRAALDRPDAAGADRAAALFALGRALYEDGQPRAAAEAFERLARDHASDAQAEEAIEAAASILLELERASPHDRDLRATLLGALTLLLDRYPGLAQAEPWRLEWARLRLNDGAFDDAETAAAQIPKSSDAWFEARFLLAHVAQKRAAATDDPARREQLLEAAAGTARAVRAELEAAAGGAGDGDASEPAASRLARLAVMEAEALIDLGRADAAIDALASAARLEDRIDRATMGAMLAARIRAYRAAGRAADAEREVSRFMSSIPEQIGAVVPAMLASFRGDVEALLDAGREDEARMAAAEELLPLAEALSRWLETAAPPRDQERTVRFQIAEALRLAGRFDEAFADYNLLLAESPDSLEFLFGRAECAYGLARWAEALVDYRRISASRREAQDRYFWQSELRMLQILDAAQRNVEQIRPRIDRLRQLDPRFGGERFRRGFEALQSSPG
jgi:tetratricopeptide (TPR) repeat protein